MYLRFSIQNKVLFLGITKALVTCFKGFMKSYKTASSFVKLVNPYLEDIAACRVDYCQTKSIPATNWVSDNFIALARIFPWFYGMYCINFQPDKDTRSYQEKRTLMQQLINSYSVMISALMTRTPDDHDKDFVQGRVKVIEQQIKVFLTACSRFGKACGDEFWEKRGNFYSLL